MLSFLSGCRGRGLGRGGGEGRDGFGGGQVGGAAGISPGQGAGMAWLIGSGMRLRWKLPSDWGM